IVATQALVQSGVSEATNAFARLDQNLNLNTGRIEALEQSTKNILLNQKHTLRSLGDTQHDIQQHYNHITAQFLALQNQWVAVERSFEASPQRFTELGPDDDEDKYNKVYGPTTSNENHALMARMQTCESTFLV
ncbi:MAG: hypothetical protein Q9218_008202, partial [Villophora microphyllina]